MLIAIETPSAAERKELGGREDIREVLIAAGAWKDHVTSSDSAVI